MDDRGKKAKCSPSQKAAMKKKKCAQKYFAKLRKNKGRRNAKKKTRPKYVPGPIGALIDQAETVGLHLTINQNDELEFTREGRGPIPLTKRGKTVWVKEVKQHINDDLLKELHDAVKPAQDDGGQEIPTRRKDMVGFPSMVDRHATMALL